MRALISNVHKETRTDCDASAVFHAEGASYLIRPVEEADAVADPQRVDIVGQAALGELVRLDVVQTHDRLRHDAAVPVSAVALVTFKQRNVFHLESEICENE